MQASAPQSSPPRFSAVIPTYNRAKFLPLAIESVLRQTFASFEIVVVDDGSKDDTASVAQTYAGRIQYLRQPNRGVSAARNAGVAAARGEWVAFLDSDDEWQPDFFATLDGLIRRHPQAVGVALNSIAVAIDGVETDNFAERELPAVFGTKTELYLEKPFAIVVRHHITTLQSVAFVRPVLQGARGFDETLTIAEDLDLIAEMALHGPFVLSTAVAARILRRAEEGANLSAQFFREGIKTRLAWARVYDRFLGNAKLSAAERAVVRREFASNQRALGNHHLEQGSPSEARAAYASAWRLDHSPASAGRYVLSFLPLGLGRRMLRRAAPAGSAT